MLQRLACCMWCFSFELHHNIYTVTRVTAYLVLCDISHKLCVKWYTKQTASFLYNASNASQTLLPAYLFFPFSRCTRTLGPQIMTYLRAPKKRRVKTRPDFRWWWLTIIQRFFAVKPARLTVLLPSLRAKNPSEVSGFIQTQEISVKQVFTLF